MINQLLFLQNIQVVYMVLITIFSVVMINFLTLDDFKPTLNIFRRNPVIMLCVAAILVMLFQMARISFLVNEIVSTGKALK